ncbi:hypothetical protein ACKWTF_010930 [Chironomus riparius]
MATFHILILLLATFADHPRFHVEGHPLTNKETEIATTTEIYDELTTITSDEKINSTTDITLGLSSFMPQIINHSLYDELKAEETTIDPLFKSPFDTSSEFSSRFDMIGDDQNDIDESTSTEVSMERMFKENENEFRDNSTKEERHRIDEIKIDEKIILYSSRNQSSTANHKMDENETTETESEEMETTTVTQLPLSSSTTMPLMNKKGKYLDLMPPGEDNMNTSLPNSPEVWALASMRDVEGTRKQFNDDDENLNNSDVELLNVNMMNNTVKNLLDFSEIAKFDNHTSVENLNKSSTVNDITSYDDAAVAENKEVSVSTASIATSTVRSTIDDNRIELEHEHVEFIANKSEPVISKIDTELFEPTSDLNNTTNSHDDFDVELITPLSNSNDNGKNKKPEKLKLAESDMNETTTESSEKLTTPATLFDEEATTIESVGNTDATTTVSSIDVLIGEDRDDENDDDEEGAGDVFKRTITEMPDMKTEEFTTVTTQMPTTTTERYSTTLYSEIPTTTTTELPKTTTFETTAATTTEIPTTKSTLVTKSISIRVATTTEEPETDILTTLSDSSEIFSSSSNYPTSSEYYDVSASSSSPPIEIADDDKFKYNTLLPETTTSATTITQDTSRSGKSGGTDEVGLPKDGDLNKQSLDGESSGSNIAIISISISVVVFVILAAGGFIFFKKRKKQLTYGQRCRPVGLDAYSLDNVSVYNSVRRKANALRLSKRSYGNSAFEDPSLQSNVLDYQSLQDFTKNKISIYEEFKEIPQVSVRVDEVPENCEDKNRYANVVPLPETRVHLQRLNDDEKTEYINANYVKGPKDTSNYYIATQAPLENTVGDFWRMIWEQNSKVIVMVTDLTENGVERCAEYIPASIVLDNTITFGDFQVTLKSREVKGKYAVSQLHVKNLKTNTWREIMHLWYSWPETGCPTDESSVISMLLEARGHLRTSLPEQLDENSNAENNNNVNDKEKLSTLDKTKSLQRVQG